MELVYRGIKYSSNNLKALKIIQKHKYRLIYSRKLKPTLEKNKFPCLKYLYQLLISDRRPIRSPNKFWYKHQISHLEKCFNLNEITLLDSCWKITLSLESKVLNSNSPVKMKYRGVTYYK